MIAMKIVHRSGGLFFMSELSLDVVPDRSVRSVSDGDALFE